MAEVPASVRMLAADRGFQRLRPAGAGVEFRVFEAIAPDGSKVVLRTPVGGRFQSSANDGRVDTRSLLHWEYAVTRHLARLGFPVAAPRELAAGEPDVLVSDFVADDGHGADQAALGGLLRRLHRSPLPPVPPAAAHGLPPARLLPRRIADRFARLAAFVTAAPPAPSAGQLAAVLASRGLRPAAPGRASAGLDYETVLDGYGERVPADSADSAAFWVYRLDAAVMLALLFSSEPACAGLGPPAVDRLREVLRRLGRALSS